MSARPPSTVEALTACLAALESTPPDLRGAIRHAAAAWCASRRPELADLVDRLCERRYDELEQQHKASRSKAVFSPPQKLRTIRALEACRRLVSANLFTEDDEGPYPEDEDESFGDNDDPRLARAIFRMMFERTLLQGNRARDLGWVEAHATRLAALGDVRFIEPLREMLATANAFPSKATEARVRPSYEAALAQLEARARDLAPLDARSAKVLACLEALVPATAAPAPKVATKFLSVTAAEALAAVFAEPEDDSVRQVCGDRLLEAGDPRGEYISLVFHSLKQKLPPASVKRMEALYNKNAGHWSGPLAPIGTREGMRFEKGFLAQVSLDKSSIGLTREMWDDALDSEYWATVEQLNVSERCPDWWLRAFLASPRSARLKRLAFRPQGTTKPFIVLERPAGAAPGAPFRLTKASKVMTKFDKALAAFSPEQLALLAEDAERLKSSFATAAIGKVQAAAKKPARRSKG